jgi:uncharacterized membrane protein YvlD (DUF360 family)
MPIARRSQLRVLLHVLVITVLIANAPLVLDGVAIDGYAPALISAVVYVLLSAAIGWLIRLPIAVLSILPGLMTLGLFFLLVPIIANAVLLKLTAFVLSSFDLPTWTAAFLLSLALRLAELLVDRIVSDGRWLR